MGFITEKKYDSVSKLIFVFIHGYTLYTQEGGIVRLYVLVLIYPDTK